MTRRVSNRGLFIAAESSLKRSCIMHGSAGAQVQDVESATRDQMQCSEEGARLGSDAVVMDRSSFEGVGCD